MHGTGNDLDSQGNKIKVKREGRQGKCNLQLEKSHCLWMEGALSSHDNTKMCS